MPPKAKSKSPRASPKKQPQRATQKRAQPEVPEPLEDSGVSTSAESDISSMASDVVSTENDGPSLKTTSGKRSRRNSALEPPKKKKTTAGRLLRSLIALDSYDSDLAYNVQQEDKYNESASLDSARVSEKLAAEKLQRESDLAEFVERDRQLDAECPDIYKKFRPKGYTFNLPPKDRPIRIYADGVFDLFHLGHMKQLEQCKKSLPNVHMIVGVPSDRLTHKYKGLTVLSDQQRCESLSHCRWVDEVVPNAPWTITQEFLDEHQIDYVAHDDIPYESAGSDDVYAFVKRKGMFMVTQRTEGVSTSDIITRIVKDYDAYLMRNFARGVSRKDLNVSWLKKNELDIKRHVNQFRENFNKNTVPKTRDLYADVLGLMQSVLKHSNRGGADKFKTSFQGGTGSNPLLDGVRNWVKKISSEAPSDASDNESIPELPSDDSN